jgi:hypothetical protein
MFPSAELCLPPDLRVDAGQLRRQLVPLEDMPLDPPPLFLRDPATATRFRTGAPVRVDTGDLPAGARRVLDQGGRLLGVGEIAGGLLRPRVVLDRAPR